MLKKVKQLHLVGIGGAGMSGIAEILLNLGCKVTGSDLELTEVTERLGSLGASIVKGHNRQNLSDADAVVISSAVRPDNPEVLEARNRRVPVIRRAEMLAELMRLKYGVCIAGTHGKTTTTSMVGSILAEGGLDPTVIVGGSVKDYGSNAKAGDGDFLVAEADEFDHSFLSLSPTIAVITTIESEHLDCYKDLEEIKDAFVTFANKIPFYGTVIACLDEESVQGIIPRIEKKLVTYGLSTQADLRAADVSFSGSETRFNVLTRTGELGKITMQVPGLHNVKNALAAITVGLELDISFLKIRLALKDFTGVHRRFEIKGKKNGVILVDDYAHHPTEIEATLKAAKDGWDNRVIAIFQPHLYSRTQTFHQEFGKAFLQSDLLFVTDVYPAREDPIPGVTGELIANAARKCGHRQVYYVPKKKDLPARVLPMITSGDMVITLGAGDIWKIGDEIYTKL